jgi:hypothetical protein
MVLSVEYSVLATVSTEISGIAAGVAFLYNADKPIGR